MKKTICSLLATLAVVCCIGACGCKGKNGEKPKQDVVFTIEQEDVALLVNDSFSLTPVAKKNDERIENAELSFASADETIVVCADEVLTTKKAGKTTVTIRLRYENKNVATKEISVTVNENRGLVPNRNFYQLYTVSEFKGKSYEREIDLSATYYENGTARTIENMTWETTDSTVAKVENGKLTAQGIGKTSLVGTYTAENGDVLKTKPLSVSVDTAIADSSADLIVDLQKDEQSFYAFGIFGKEAKIGKMLNRVTGDSYAMQNGVLKTPSILSGEYEFCVYSEDLSVACNVNLIVADYVIYDAEDILKLAEMSNEYVALANNIDGVEYTVAEEYSSNWYSNYMPFRGTFNGLGHTVSDLTLQTVNCGLVCSSSGATWKNVAFKNVTYASTGQGLFGYKSISSNTVDNVYVSVKDFKGTHSGGALFGLLVSGSLKISNSVVDMQSAKLSNNGMLFGRSNGVTVTMENVIVFGSGVLCSKANHSLNTNYGEINAKTSVVHQNAQSVFSAVENELLRFDGFNSCWSLADGIPVFSYKDESGEKDDVGAFDPEWIVK